MSQSAPSSTVAALLPSGTPHWGNNGTVLNGSSVGGAVTVTYGFLTSSRQISSADSTGFAAMNTAQRTAVRQALAAWSAVANITFVEISDAASAEVAFGTNRQSGQSAAYAYYPSTGAQGGQVFLANDSSGNANPTVGSYSYMTVIHEIGHALGLKHPGNYNAGSDGGTEGPYLPTATDNYAYSIMSYNDNDALPSGTYLTGPSLYDIAAIQYLYGANMSTGAGDTSYTLNTGTFTTLWDPNGRNSLNGSAQTASLAIDLRDGQFSSAGSTTFLALAYGTKVQQATGGSGNDSFTVNTLGDVLDGGAGTDTVVFSGSRAQYSVQQLDTGRYIVSGADGNDILSNIEFLRFSDGSVSLSSAVTGSFDALRYVASNTDLIAALGTNTAAATQHLAGAGVYEGRSLTGFDPYNYLAGYGDLLGSFGTDVTAATRHYIEVGNREGRSSTLFDTLSYQASNPDLIAAFGSNREAAELHYIVSGRLEGRSLTRFNAAAYLAANPDVNSAVGGNLTAAKQHYVSFGYAEGRAVG
ncbi:protease [Azospirillum sp. TSH100]|uniref:matrixin family metalloprotease n=1 Tax=Azospirillum sp. TSH100 TaxID=652764 RepID=UPI000D61C114|nr:matrixin family metalloprotease [Azospirillum sp. TSH100]PWC85817.1 protease [Azospirillum sp. TSH100]QCG87868.1 matrixin family metalloprotease [Azospirillum sp. TSH100]